MKLHCLYNWSNNSFHQKANLAHQGATRTNKHVPHYDYACNLPVCHCTHTWAHILVHTGVHNCKMITYKSKTTSTNCSMRICDASCSPMQCTVAATSGGSEHVSSIVVKCWALGGTLGWGVAGCGGAHSDASATTCCGPFSSVWLSPSPFLKHLLHRSKLLTQSVHL